VTGARAAERGVTYLELLATAAILLILSAAIIPVATKARQRRNEMELRVALKTLRHGIARYRLYSEEGVSTPNGKKIEPKDPPLPTTLAELTEEKNYIGGGVPETPGGPKSAPRFRAMRAIPRDPMSDSAEWGLRCYEDDWDSTSWCGSNIWDVYSKNKGRALDGSHYNEW
jgi:general secretion pathway protein G